MLTALMLMSPVAAKTITVDAGGGADYVRIQDAINSASNGDTIIVYSGTYYENVDVNKPLILQGKASDGRKPVVNAGSRGNAINLSAGNSIIEFFNVTIGGWPYTGIYVNSNNNSIKSNEVALWREDCNGNGIFLVKASGNILTGNYVKNSIRLEHSDNNMLDGNIASNCADGIYLNSSSNNTLRNNTAWNNWYSITLQFSNNNNLTNNNASNNGEGFDIMRYSNYNNLNGNTAKSNRGNGILLSTNSNYNNLNNNIVSKNKVGISLYLSSNNTLSSNMVSNNNFVGIRSGSSYDDIFYNNFFNNTRNFEFNVVILGSKIVNTWNITKIAGTNIISGPYLGGNVWANPNGTGFSQTCADGDRDEICDSPYKLDNYFVDQVPLAYKPSYYGHELNVKTIAIIPDETKEVLTTGQTPKEGSTENADGFEVVMAIVTLLTIYLLGRTRG